jgi:serine/threonine-protein kinase RsbW
MIPAANGGPGESGRRAGAASFAGPYREVSLRRAQEVAPLLEDVALAMAGRGYSLRDRSGVRLALEEAIVNALRHGNGYDPSKCVRVRYQVAAEGVLAEVQDEGPGFDPAAVPDPTPPEHLDRACGRGLQLMRQFMTAVRFGGRGNRVFLYKRRAPEPPPPHT